MPTQPAIPSLLVIPDKEGNDYRSIYAVACAYSHSGLMLNEYVEKEKEIAFTFPAMVCSSFALELFLKFFLTLANAEAPGRSATKTHGHGLENLWERLKSEHQDLIAGMHKNTAGEPFTNALDRRKELFLERLRFVDKSEPPFVKWRYVHEVAPPTMMSHGAVQEVLNSVGRAAEYAMQQRREVDGATKG